MKTTPTHSDDNLLIEACVASVAAARNAEDAGADRIELNCALELDGLTPSAGLLQRVIREIRIPIIAMARPRAGDFCYSSDEWTTMRADVKWLLDHGASGIAFGALTSDRQIDQVRCAEMRSLVGTAELVFHKAFDEVNDPDAALEALIESGVNRLMTSGLAATAMAGADQIANLIQTAGSRIEILPAGRINSQNVKDLVEKTGCRQIHGSFSGGKSITDEIQLIRRCFPSK